MPNTPELAEQYLMHTGRRLPVTFVRGEGCLLYDEEGKEYLDLVAGIAVNVLGHAHPDIAHALSGQARTLIHTSNLYFTRPQVELARRLVELSFPSRVFLCNSGAEANENALKLASFHNGRKKIVAFRKSFHGRTSLAVAATDNPAIVAPVNQTENVVFLPFNDEQALEDYFAKHGDETAAIIIEGIQGVGGINVADLSFLQKIRSLCSTHNTVFIADSVQCGYGRTGKFFSHDHAGIDADIYSMAKGMGYGFPVAGIMIAHYLKAKHGMLGTTFGGNHLACAAALAVLEVMEEEKLMENAKSTGEFLMNALREIKDLKNLRGKGLMIGFDVSGELKDLRKDLLHHQQVFTGESKPNTIRLLPSLALRKKEAEEFLESLTEEINHLTSSSNLVSQA